MAPKRKKLKSDNDDTSEQPLASGSQEQAESSTTTPEANITNAPSTPAKAPPAQVRTSWSWRSKATPIAQLARDTVSVAQGATSSSSETPERPPPSSVSKSIRGSRKSIPLAAEATKVHATSDINRSSFSAEEKSKAAAAVGSSEGKNKEVVVEDAPLPPDPNAMDGIKDEDKTTESTHSRNTSWFGWWSRPDGYGSDGEKATKRPKLDITSEVASSTPLPGTPNEEPANPMIENARQFEGVAPPSKADEIPQMTESLNQRYSKTWFGLWSTAQNQQAATEERNKDGEVEPTPEIAVSTDPPEVEEAAKAAETPDTDSKKQGGERRQSAGWAFWSSDRPKDLAPTPGGTRKQIGELAVADTPSQSNPEAAQFNEQRETPPQVPPPKKAGSLLRPKRGREKESSSSTATAATDLSKASTAVVSESPSRSSTPVSDHSEIAKPPPKGVRPNSILPSFQDTFSPYPSPGYIERLTQYLAQSLHLPGSEISQSQHVFIHPSPAKVKKAVALGIHGFFPGALIQKLLGQPTGTSIRFANYAATAIKTWCAEHQPDLKDVEVEKVALEGEGFIADRVTTLWKLLLNWLSHLRNADFILVACHSQGVPVAITLVAKLIQLGALSSNVRIGVCAMAGINLGPFLEYKSRLFGGTALELFDFCDSESKVSRSYADSLDVCLRHGVRITYVGSIDDQLVSLESSLHMPLSHPYVSRAVFIDGRLHAPNFLTHLVVFALKLRNLGISDHGLIRELSAPLAGSLVGGEGHSRVYDDPEVYRLAVEFALQSTDVQAPPISSTPPAQTEKAKANTTRTGPLENKTASSALESTNRSVSLTATSNNLTGIPPTITAYETPPTTANTNPFYLPWAVRGMLEEDLVKKDPKMREEVVELVREFEAWRPTSKVLRDVRWRLEGVRSMV